MPQFEFTQPASKTAGAWLAAAAEYLRDSSPAEQREWIGKWLPFMRDAPIYGDVTAFDKSLVIITLERWASEITERHAA